MWWIRPNAYAALLSAGALACASEPSPQEASPQAPIACPAMAQLQCVALQFDPVPQQASVVLTAPDGSSVTSVCPGQPFKCPVQALLHDTVASDCNNVWVPLAAQGVYQLAIDAHGYAPTTASFEVKTDACGFYTQAPSRLAISLSAP